MFVSVSLIVFFSLVSDNTPPGVVYAKVSSGRCATTEKLARRRGGRASTLCQGKSGNIHWIVLGASDPVSGIPNVTGGAYLSTHILFTTASVIFGENERYPIVQCEHVS